MRYSLTLPILFLAQLACTALLAQDLRAIGEWRDHFTYMNTISITEAGNSIYCASNTSVFRYDRTTNEIERINKVNALSDVGINGVEYSEDYGTTLVYYTNGNLDLLQGSTSFNMGDIRRSSILGNKAINSVHFKGQLAYLACGFGIVVVDLERREVRETWFIGPAGSQVNVREITSTADSIYAATNAGLFSASLNAPNLAAFTSWHRRSDMGAAMAEGPFTSITSFGDRLFLNYRGAAVQTDTILILQPDDQWVKFEAMYGRENRSFKTTKDGQHMVITQAGAVLLFDQALQQVNAAFDYSPLGIAPLDAVFATDGRFYIADHAHSMLRSAGGYYTERLAPNGPLSASVYRMDMAKGVLFAATGAVEGNWTNSFRKEGVHHYANGEWRTDHPFNNPFMVGGNTWGGAVNDVMAVAVDPRDPLRAFVGSWEDGLLEFYDRVPTLYHNGTNSTLQPPVSGPDEKINVAGLDFDQDGNLWVSNGLSTRPIQVYTRDGQWYAFDPGSVVGGNYLVSDILAASNGYKWVVRPRGNAVLVFNDNGTISNTSDDQYKVLRNQTGEGGLPSPDVYCLAEDHDGEIWLGTSRGVAVFYNPSAIFSGGDFDAQQILIEQDGNVQILLETEIVTSIAVDGADRKWIGTQSSGVFLISPDGREQVHHFTQENSPLPNNSITSLAIDEISGEVFIGTERGIISYRSDATEGGTSADCASVFPNPVRPDHTGPIAVTGLMRDSEVKITDVSGNLVYRTTSLGGQAIWNGNDMSGNRVATGVYLIFASDRSGSYKCNTKVLVVR